MAAQKETDKAIARYRAQRAAVNLTSLSSALRDALDLVEGRATSCQISDRLVYVQSDDAGGNAIIDGFSGFRREIDGVLPLLVDATSSDIIARKTCRPPQAHARAQMGFRGGRHDIFLPSASRLEQRPQIHANGSALPSPQRGQRRRAVDRHHRAQPGLSS